MRRQQRQLRQQRVRQQHQHRVFPAAEGRPQPDRQGALAHLAVGLEIAVVVDHQHGRGGQANHGGSGQQARGPVQRLQVIAAAHGHEAEEEQHHQVAKGGVGDRPRPARVGHRRRCRHHPKQQDRPATAPGQRQPDGGGQQETGARCGAHLHRAEQPQLRGARQAQAPGAVGAALEIAHVVVEVGAQLQQQRAQHAGQHQRQVDAAGLGPDQRASHEHGVDADGERVRPRGDDPRPPGGPPAAGWHCAALLDLHPKILLDPASHQRKPWRSAVKSNHSRLPRAVCRAPSCGACLTYIRAPGRADS